MKNPRENLSLEEAIADGLKTLRLAGHSCEVSVQDFESWFQADTPYPDITIDEVIENPLLVVHDIVEIDAVKKLGLELGKAVITTNLELVDKSHFKAAQIEMEMAIAAGNQQHISERLKDIRAWSTDPLTGPEMRRSYSEMADRVAMTLAKLMKKN